jgi:hypothetical protein
LKDLSLHILDLAQNSLRAGATLVNFHLDECTEENLFVLEIKDNGKGMSDQEQEKALNPFYTTRTTRRVGLGLSLFEATVKRCGGELIIISAPGKGTQITATFILNHWDIPPLGDIAGSLVTLIAGNPEVDFVYVHRRGAAEFLFDTRIIKDILEEVPISTPSVLDYLQKDIEKGLLQITNFKSNKI